MLENSWRWRHRRATTLAQKAGVKYRWPAGRPAFLLKMSCPNVQISTPAVTEHGRGQDSGTGPRAPNKKWKSQVSWVERSGARVNFTCPLVVARWFLAVLLLSPAWPVGYGLSDFDWNQRAKTTNKEDGLHRGGCTRESVENAPRLSGAPWGGMCPRDTCALHPHSGNTIALAVPHHLPPATCPKSIIRILRTNMVSQLVC